MRPTCPACSGTESQNLKHSENPRTKKIGFYVRKSDGLQVQRFRCRSCHKAFSSQTFSLNYRYRKRRLNQPLFRMLGSSVSQRRAASILGVNRKTVDRRIDRFGHFGKASVKAEQSGIRLDEVMFDEMESFEHTKCKPLTIPIAVDPATRKILVLDVAPIAAKGPLAKIARKKYGHRACGRKESLSSFCATLEGLTNENPLIKTDMSRHYPAVIKETLPGSQHLTYKGRRGCVVGQGELKRGGFDPLFMLNHTYAMVRDGIKRLTRKTWTTTKKPKKLRQLLWIYACFHNQKVGGCQKPILPLFGHT